MLEPTGDTCIPPSGGVSIDQGWIYESLRSQLGLWSGVHGCSSPHGLNRGEAVNTTMDAECYVHCRRNGSEATAAVMSCTYAGIHGTWPMCDAAHNPDCLADPQPADGVITSFFLAAVQANATEVATPVKSDDEEPERYG